MLSVLFHVNAPTTSDEKVINVSHGSDIACFKLSSVLALTTALLIHTPSNYGFVDFLLTLSIVELFY